jgi:hypothetical protein
MIKVTAKNSLDAVQTVVKQQFNSKVFENKQIWHFIHTAIHISNTYFKHEHSHFSHHQIMNDGIFKNPARIFHISSMNLKYSHFNHEYSHSNF